MSDKRKRTAGKMPVSAHPAFPAIVALWFAGLLGIGTLVLPAVLIERIGGATGLSSYFVAAQPPLGMTARIAMALGAGIAGTLAGLAIARMIARAHAEKPAARRPAADASGGEPGSAAAKRPISAHDELFEGGLDADSEVHPARDDFADTWRPLPVTGLGADNDEFGEDFREDFGSAPDWDYRPNGASAAPAADIAVDAETVSAEAAGHAGLLDLGAFEEASDEDPANAWERDPPCEDSARVHEAAFEPHDGPPCGESAVAGTADGEAETPRSALHDTDSLPPVSEPAFGEMEEMTRTASPWPLDPSPAPIDAAGSEAIVDLVDRFARALQRHRQGSSADNREAEEATATPGEETFADRAPADWSRPVAGLDFAAQGIGQDAAGGNSLASTGPGEAEAASPRVPDALREIDFEYDAFEEEDDDGVPALDLSLSLAQSARPFGLPDAAAAGIDAIPATEVEDDEDEAEDDGAEENYPSLLAMKSTFGVQREPVRIVDEAPADEDGADAIEPVATFSAQRAPNGEAEQALRDALEKLQRMSGAA